MTPLSPPLDQCEHSFLMACLRFYFGTATANEIICLPEPDWAVLLQMAIDKGVMPLLYQSLKTLNLEQMPPSCLIQLQQCHRMNGLHNISQTRELLRILDQLQASGIEAIAFKGAIIAASAYGNVALRQFNDLDILVKQQDFCRLSTLISSHNLGPVRILPKV